ncbi:MAG: YveK family protein [Caldilinea sp.]
MELKAYGVIFKRRGWLPVGLTLLVGLLSLIQLRPWQPTPPVYTASLRMLVGVLPAAEQDVAAYDPRYYAWLTSEYLVDDFTEVVRSQLFAERVSQRLQGVSLPPGVIQSSAATGKLHRIITLNFTWGDATQIKAVARAAADELTQNTGFYFQQLGTDRAGVTLLDGPTVGVVGRSTREQVEFPLRLLVAFLAGVGLIFWLHYLDGSIRLEEELEALGIPVLGSIPRRRYGLSAGTPAWFGGKRGGV